MKFDWIRGILAWAAIIFMFAWLIERGSGKRALKELKSERDSIEKAVDERIARLRMEIDELESYRTHQLSVIRELVKANDSLSKERENVRVIYVGNADAAKNYTDKETEKYWKNEFQ